MIVPAFLSRNKTIKHINHATLSPKIALRVDIIDTAIVTKKSEVRSGQNATGQNATRRDIFYKSLKFQKMRSVRVDAGYELNRTDCLTD